MAESCYSAIDNCGAQWNRLDCDGTVLNGPSDVVLSCALVEISWNPIQGEERSASDADGRGGKCANRVKPATIEGYEITVTFCSKTDPELMELLGIMDLVQDAEGNTIGMQPVNEDEDCDCVPTEGCTDPGVDLHVWHVPWCGDEVHPDYASIISAFPKIKFDRSSLTMTRNTDFNTYTVTGRTYKNPLYGQGPGSVYPNPAGLQVDWAEFGSDIPWPGGCACDFCGYASAEDNPLTSK